MTNIETCFRPLHYAANFSKGLCKDDIIYYVENLAVAEKFDWFNVVDTIKYLAQDKHHFEEKMDVMLKLLLKTDKNKGNAYIVDGVDIRKEFCRHAAMVLEYVEPHKEFLYALTYKYVSHVFCDYRFLSLFFFYDGPHKEYVYKGIVEGLTKGCNLDLYNLDKKTKNGKLVRDIFKRVFGKVDNPEELPLELYRILKTLKKVVPIMDYERFAIPKTYIQRTEKQEEQLSTYRLSVLLKAFDSLHKKDSDIKDSIVKGLQITKDSNVHSKQTSWFAKKLFKVNSRNDYLLIRGLMNDEDSKPFIDRYTSRDDCRFRVFAKAYEGNRNAISLLCQKELLLLFFRLPEDIQKEQRIKVIRIFNKCIHYKDGKKQLSLLFPIVMNDPSFLSNYRGNKYLYDETMLLASLRKPYLEKMILGENYKDNEAYQLSKHLFVKLWDGCVSVWNKTKEGVDKTKQFLVSLVEDCNLIVEAVSRDKEGKIIKYSAATVYGPNCSRQTFKTASKRRAGLFFLGLLNTLKRNLKEFMELKVFDPVFKLIDRFISQTEAGRA